MAGRLSSGPPVRAVPASCGRCWMPRQTSTALTLAQEARCSTSSQASRWTVRARSRCASSSPSLSAEALSWRPATAAAAGRASALLTLTTRGADTAAKDQGGRLPMHLIPEADLEDKVTAVELLKWLVDPRTDVINTATDTAGRFCLHAAALRGRPAFASALLDGRADPARRDAEGATPLHLAAATAGSSGSGSE